MKFIKPSVEIIDEEDLFKRIEIGARNCWRSDDRICEGSAEKMFQNLVKRDHESPMEHSMIHVETGKEVGDELYRAVIEYTDDVGLPSYISCQDYYGGNPEYKACHFFGNLRAWRSLVKWLISKWDECVFQRCTSSLMKCLPGVDGICLPEMVDPATVAYAYAYPADMYDGDNYTFVTSNDPHLDRHNIITARFICDRAVQNELVRHRLLGLSVESTRYVRYEDGLTLIEPWWWPQEQETTDTTYVRMACQAAEDAYCSLIRSGCSPQKARCVLPLMLKTEVVATGTIEYWQKYVLPLRLSKAAHPDIRRLMELFCEQLGWDPNDFRK